MSEVQILPPRPICGCSSVVELFVANEVVVSSNLITRSILVSGQMVRHLFLVQVIVGSSPTSTAIGGVAEWLNAPVLKTGKGESLSRVRIPPPPPLFGRLAQLGEHLVYTERVGSSSLSSPTKYKGP